MATDSEDDKKIRRAEDRAQAKLEKYNKSENDDKLNYPFVDSHTSINSMARHFIERREVICWKCGNPGHFATGCVSDFFKPQQFEGIGVKTET